MPDELSVPLDLQPDDHRQFIRHRDLEFYRGRFLLHLVWPPALLLTWAAWEAWRAGGVMQLVKADPFALLLPFAIVLWVLYRFKGLDRKARRLARRTPPGSRLRLAEEGLVVERRGRTRMHAWKDIVAVEEQRGLVLFVHKQDGDAFKATILPARHDPEGALLRQARERWAAARITPVQ